MIGMKLVIGLLLVSCLYVLQLYFNKNIWLKIFVVTSFFIVSSLTYFSFESYKGWPTTQRVASGYLVDVQIVTPSQGSAGGIYMWIVDEPRAQTLIESFITYRFEHQPAPRSYYIPYSKQADKAMSAAKKKIKDGFVVKIEGDGESVEGAIGNRTGKKGGNSGDAENYNVPNLQIISPNNILKKQE